MLNLHCKDLQYFQISIDVRFPKSYGCWQWAKPKWGGGGLGINGAGRNLEDNMPYQIFMMKHLCENSYQLLAVKFSQKSCVIDV